MSRIGKLPVAVPQGVTAAVSKGVVDIQGPKGKISFTVSPKVSVKVDGGKIVLDAPLSDKQAKADFGTARSVINNMVKGVTTGWKRTLELNGVGYTAKVSGQVIVLTVGFSHDVHIEIPKSVKCAVNKTTIELESVDKHAVGQLASKIRKVKPPEPYLGKGIKYSEEVIRRKAGKTAKK